MRIRELADRTGLTPETIRYYERIGLVKPPVRDSNNYRIYGAEQLKALSFIKHCRNLGLGLEDIRDLLEASSTAEGADKAHEMIHQQIQAVDERIRDLKALRRQLRDLAESCRGDHSDGHVCGILQDLESPVDGGSAELDAALGKAIRPL